MDFMPNIKSMTLKCKHKDITKNNINKIKLSKYFFNKSDIFS